MKLGIDPEFFVLNQSNKPINAYKLCKNKTTKPLNIDDINIYHDNVLLEGNTSPALSERDFLLSVQKLITNLLNIAKGYKLSLDGFIEYDESELEFENAKDFGCKPDYDAYSLTINDTMINNLRDTNFRTAGGHIHIGGQSHDDVVLNPILKPIFVFMLDLFVGIPSVLIDHSTQTFRRRQFFGAAGCHRDKSYGVEYRVLSPFWLRDKSTQCLIYKLCEFVYNECNDGLYKKFVGFDINKLKGSHPEQAYSCYGYDKKGVINAINNCDTNQARRFYNFASNFMPNELIEHIEHEVNSPKIQYLI
jgi:hypothetical protein